MLKSNLLKNMKSFLWRYKFISFLVLALLIFVPIVVFSYSGSPQNGYSLLPQETLVKIFHMNDASRVAGSTNVNSAGICAANTTGDNLTDSSHVAGVTYFIPTGSLTDWNSLNAAAAAQTVTGLVLYECYGNGVCSASAGENCVNDPSDCGTCPTTETCNYDGICDQGEDILCRDTGDCCVPDCQDYCDDDCVCDGNEGSLSPTCNDCVTNCGYGSGGTTCGDGYCDVGEDYGSCAQDCSVGGGSTGDGGGPCDAGFCAWGCSWNCS